VIKGTVPTPCAATEELFFIGCQQSRLDRSLNIVGKLTKFCSIGTFMFSIYYFRIKQTPIAIRINADVSTNVGEDSAAEVLIIPWIFSRE